MAEICKDLSENYFLLRRNKIFACFNCLNPTHLVRWTHTLINSIHSPPRALHSSLVIIWVCLIFNLSRHPALAPSDRDGARTWSRLFSPHCFTHICGLRNRHAGEDAGLVAKRQQACARGVWNAWPHSKYCNMIDNWIFLFKLTTRIATLLITIERFTLILIILVENW